VVSAVAVVRVEGVSRSLAEKRKIVGSGKGSGAGAKEHIKFPAPPSRTHRSDLSHDQPGHSDKKAAEAPQTVSEAKSAAREDSKQTKPGAAAATEAPAKQRNRASSKTVAQTASSQPLKQAVRGRGEAKNGHDAWKKLSAHWAQQGGLLSQASCPECKEDPVFFAGLPAVETYSKKYKSCLLVGHPGNGECGTMIDAYDAVVRFNSRALLSPAEAPKEGTKVTHVFLNSNEDVDNFKSLPAKVDVFHQVANDNAQSYMVASHREQLLKVMKHGYHQLHFGFVHEALQLTRSMSNDNKAVPTSGFLAFLFMNDRCDKMDLLGFEGTPGQAWEDHGFDNEHAVEKAVRPDARFLNTDTCQ